MRPHYLIFLLLGAWMVLDCTSQAQCVPGSTQECFCAVGQKGIQLCQKKSNTWGECHKCVPLGPEEDNKDGLVDADASIEQPVERPPVEPGVEIRPERKKETTAPDRTEHVTGPDRTEPVVESPPSDKKPPLPSCGHPFPRTGVFNWGGAPAWWYARFDLLSLRKQSAAELSKIRSFNPQVLLLYMEDWNVAAHLGNNIPKGCALKTSKGQYFGLYNKVVNPAPGQRAMNWTDYAKTGGKLCRRWFAEYIVGRIDLKNVYNGISTDGLWAGKGLNYLRPKDLDLDQNGVNDYSEHGKDWVNNKWNDGVKGLLQELRNLLGDSRMMINTGVGYLSHASIAPINGVLFEFAGAENSWDWHRGVITNFIKKTRKPHTTLFAANPFGSDRAIPKPARNYFTFVRYMLTKAMLVDAFFHFQIDTRHTFSYYYDEYDVKIGCPTSEMQEVGDRDIWVRFFTDGVAVHNAAGKENRVTEQDLQALKGYDGPYYRFQGGQDSAVNNGQKFTSITLKGHSFKGNVLYQAGDGIILVKTPRTVVSDILIDDLDMGTSPGSPKAELKGSWKIPAHCKDGNDHYTLTCYKNEGDTHFTTEATASAIYRPTIGVAGRYQVYEWHGFLDSQKESAKVPYTLVYEKGKQRKGFLDQTQNSGRWNSLGTFRFARGSAGYLKLHGVTSGVVLADAIRFVYRGP